MEYRYLLLICTACAGLAQTPCAQLRTLSIANLTVTAAEAVAQQTLAPPAAPAAPRVTVPAHCRVAAVLAPSSDSHIEIEVWLPDTDSWNGKFEAVGNGGWAGNISFGIGAPQGIARTMVSALREGYATASNDTGHKAGASGPFFAVGHPEKLRDFAERAVHEMTVTAKQIIRAYYGNAPRLSYWNGCSTGGRQGLIEAQRYPADFDGIVAGAPANYWTHLMAAIIWSAQAAHQGQPGNLPREKLVLLHDAVLKACDAIDGVKDGVIEDPTRCKFDPGVLACRNGDATDCLSLAQVEAARNMYRGPVNPRTGRQIYPGMLPGSELGWEPVNGLQPFGIAENHFRYVLFHDPSWDYRNLNFDRDIALADEADNGLINAIDPDLRAFFAHGGKLIQYHGWNDQQISPLNSVDYYLSVQKTLGSPLRLADSYRLFMAPGMGHCGGGEGPNQFHPMAALERWRELNLAPGRIIAIHVANNTVDNTRPLCPFPQVAVYNGAGSRYDAGDFSCKLP